MNEHEYHKMARVEADHWWYCALHARVLRAVQEHFPENKDIEILDAGCGTGGLLSFLRTIGYAHAQGFDISDHAVAHCHQKGLSVIRASLTEVSAHYSPSSMDVVVCCDALYFLNHEEQRKALTELCAILRPRGLLILNLPALRAFRGTHDRSVGIGERYHHRMLSGLLPEGMACRFRYWPVLLSPVIAMIRAWQRVRIVSGNYRIESDIALPGPLVNGLLKRLMAFELKVLPPMNFGSSLFVAVRKDSSDT